MDGAGRSAGRPLGNRAKCSLTTRFPMMQNSHSDNPQVLLETYFREHFSMLPLAAEANSALQVEAVGFTRFSGDWLGVIVTPDFLRLYLLPGGGTLWGEIPCGQARYLALGGETMRFVADELPGIGACQFTSLLEPSAALADQRAARQLAERVMQGFGWLPPATPAAEEATPPGVSRRGFLRRLAGRR